MGRREGGVPPCCVAILPPSWQRNRTFGLRGTFMALRWSVSWESGEARRGLFFQHSFHGRRGLCATERRLLRNRKHHDARPLLHRQIRESRDLRRSKVSTPMSSDFQRRSLISAVITSRW